MLDPGPGLSEEGKSEEALAVLKDLRVVGVHGGPVGEVEDG